MSNRRLGLKKFRRIKSPADAVGSFVDGEAQRPRLTQVQALLLGAKVLFGGALVLAAVLGLSWAVYRYAQTTPRFAVQKIDVSGTRRLVREDLLAAADLKEGVNLFALDVDKAEKALLSSPWVAQVRVVRRLPSTVRVELVEHEPRAIATISGTSFLVSEEGVPFKELGSGDPHDFPVITGISPDALARDRRAELDRLAETLGVLRDYERLSISRAFPVQEAHLGKGGDASLVVGSEGITLHLGSGPFKQKLLRAERVLEKTRKAKGEPSIVFLDNEAHPERVVVRVR